MTVQFTHMKSDGNCIYCLEPMTNRDNIVGHHPRDSEAAHCFHDKCVNEHIAHVANDTFRCPLCQAHVNSIDHPGQAFWWQDRCVTELKCISKDILAGAVIGGTIIATTPVIIGSNLEASHLVGLTGGAVMAVGKLEDLEEITLIGATAVVSVAVLAVARDIFEEIKAPIGGSIVLGTIAVSVMRGFISRRLGW